MIRRFAPHRVHLCVSASLFGLTALPAAAAAQAQPGPAAADATAAAEADAEPDAPAAPEDGIVVTGFRQSYANEVRTKRNAIEITDGISSDDLGRIPDLNIGEALQRVPGIQLNREAEGREATINLRGLPGEYARTTLNGVAFAEPILQTSTPLGAFASDIFSAVRVQKSPMADAQSGGLSGNIDLQIAPALSRTEGGRIKIAYDHNELGKQGEPSATLGYNAHITDDFAVFGIVSFKHEKFRRDSILFNTYGVLSAATTPNFLARYADYYAPAGTCATTNAAVVGCVAAAGGTGAKGLTGVQYVSQNRQYVRRNEGNQWSAAAGAEWQASDALKLGVTGLYTDRRQSETVQNLQVLNFTGTGVVVNPTSEVQAGADGAHFVEDFDFANIGVINDSRLFPQTQKAWGVNGVVNYEAGPWRLTTTGTLSKASNSAVEIFAEFITGQQANRQNGVTGSFASGGGNYGDYLLSILPDPLSTGTPRTAWTWAGPTDQQSWYDSPVGTPGRNRFNFAGTQSYATSKVTAIQQDVEREFESGFVSSIQAGARYERNRYASQGYRTNAAGIQGSAIGNAFLAANPDLDDFFQGSLPGFNRNWQVLDMDNVVSSLKPVTPFNGAELAPIGFNINYTDNNYALYNFTNDTDVLSAYAEAKYKTEIFSIPVRGIIGLRYEHADNTVNALNRIRPASPGLGQASDYAFQEFKNSYGQWLPSAIAVFDITDKLIVRVAGYRTYVRPHPRQFTPVTLVGAPSTTNVIPVTLGNPELEPYTGTSFDGTIEWYNNKNGLVALSLFSKRFKGVVQQVRGARTLCPTDGGNLGLGPLRIEGDQCFTSAPPDINGNPQTVSLTGFINSSTPYTVNGLELNIQQDFDFLPGALSNFGGGFNYAYTTIDGTNADGTDATLPGISKHNVNVVGYYETKLFGIRLSYNYRSKYDLSSTGTFSGAARQVEPRGQLDASASVNLSDWLSLSVNGFNLTNAVRKEYQGVEAQARRIDYDGRTYRIALNARF
ncbi:TonB-dependent receptor [Allosphingosinicella deserti]|uniref:TonB-dependent receptor n=1 Tax=Allosphingosinicella deserti TaxID=2116704 RepID=A0A2P7QLX1_9SPHN|nr:TonB-dependent receptor [Sphingomonas deserti]PSJ38973.1 TonB-dependent receptor [Sphingomonas deserti]